MHKYMVALSLLLIFQLTACGAMGTCVCPEPTLNIFTDSELMVTAIRPGYPTRDDLQVGDRLLNARPAITQQDLSPDPIPFTDGYAVRALIRHRTPSVIATCCGGQPVPLIIQVERNGQIHELNVIWEEDTELPSPITQEISPLTSPIPTPTATPVPSHWSFF